MKLVIKDNKPSLRLGDFDLVGYKLDGMPPKYYNQNAIVFANEWIEDAELHKRYYDVIKNLTPSDFADDRIEFVIDYVYIDVLPEPIERLPYPFTSLTIGVENGMFRLRTSIILGLYEPNEWDKIWTTEFYFDNLSQVMENESDFRILYEKDDDSIYFVVDFLIAEYTVDLAVDKCIQILETNLRKVEYAIKGLDGFFDVVEIWDKKKYVNDERFWHETLMKYSWILSIAINEPSIILDDEAYIGGKSISNKNGNVIDFLFKNKLTDNIALIEIKTPQTKIIGKKYRNTYSLSPECSGAINQLLNYKDCIVKNYYSLVQQSEYSFSLIQPNCYLIIGSQDSMNKKQKESFELFRKSLSGINIITFDELFEKLFYILSTIHKK